MRNANEAGVLGMQTICCRIADEFDDILKTIKPMQNVWCSVGTHPHDASNDAEKAITREDIIRLAQSDDKVIGIGESGLDYYYDYADRTDQELSFRKHIQACVETGLPLIIHARDADDDCIRILKEEGAGSNGLKGVLHCFSSTEKMAMEGLDIGFHVSFSGMVTFKNMQWLRDTALKIPLDRILIETDAPFLAPVPFRGKTNQPAYVENTAVALAQLFDKTRLEIGQITADNFFNLFDKAKKTWVEPA